MTDNRSLWEEKIDDLNDRIDLIQARLIEQEKLSFVTGDSLKKTIDAFYAQGKLLDEIMKHQMAEHKLVVSILDTMK